MNYPGHLVVALLVSYLVYTLVNSTALLAPFVFPISPAVVGLVALAALFPDVDVETSTAFRLFGFVALLVGAYFGYGKMGALGILVGAAVAMVFVVIYAKFFKPRHRGPTHTLKAALVFGIVAGLLTGSVETGLVSFASYASHLLADKV